MAPAWLIVLRRWQLVEGHHGLTLPFLVGVERYQSGDLRAATARDGLREVLEEARTQKLDHQRYFLIYHCGNRDTWVLREVRDSRPYSAELQLPPKTSNHCTLAAALDPPPADSDPMDHLLDVLCDELTSPIDSESYSRHGRQWQQLNDAEYHWIDEALSNGLLPLGPSEEWLRGQAWIAATKS